MEGVYLGEASTMSSAGSESWLVIRIAVLVEANIVELQSRTSAIYRIGRLKVTIAREWGGVDA
jgi:hypothetical protein